MIFHAQVNRSYWYIIWAAIVMHAVWGVTLIIDESATFVTAISSTADILNLGHVPLGMLFISVALSATYGLVTRPSRFSVLWVLPQQAMLFLSAYGAADAAINSQFADGEPRPNAFIGADQLPHILFAVFHTLAILDREGAIDNVMVLIRERLHRWRRLR